MTYPDIIEELDVYCEATGLKPSTVCVRATDNSRFYDREKKRAELLAQYAVKIRSYIAQNPPLKGAS